MAGDTQRDAFRTELAAVIAEASPSIAWSVKDTLNTDEMPAPAAANAAAADQGYFEIEFIGGSEAQYTTGAPGANLHREHGQVTIRAVSRLRAGKTVRDLAETYLRQIRTGFRARRFAAGAGPGAGIIRITGTAPMGGGENEAGLWVESLGLTYETYNVG